MVIITDLLRMPIDEGAKVSVFNLLVKINSFHKNEYIYSINGDANFTFIDKPLKINKLFVNLSFLKSIQKKSSKKILYIPEASCTLFSFVRAKILSLFTGKIVCLLAMQPRKYGPIASAIIKNIPPEIIITQSKNTSQYLSKLGIKNYVLPLGVDDTKFIELVSRRKAELRKKRRIASDKTVLLHVGHIQESRNLDWLLQVKNKLPEIEIIIVGSTYSRDDVMISAKLSEAGIRIIREYISNMEELYNLADYYIFPVLRNDGAIETPLSVLEAMSCNLPIITTKFGSLPDTFNKDNDFHYVNSVKEIVEIVEREKLSPCKNREKIRPFTWDEIARKLVDIVEQ